MMVIVMVMVIANLTWERGMQLLEEEHNVLDCPWSNRRDRWQQLHRRRSTIRRRPCTVCTVPVVCALRLSAFLKAVVCDIYDDSRCDSQCIGRSKDEKNPCREPASCQE